MHPWNIKVFKTKNPPKSVLIHSADEVKKEQSKEFMMLDLQNEQENPHCKGSALFSMDKVNSVNCSEPSCPAILNREPEPHACKDQGCPNLAQNISTLNTGDSQFSAPPRGCHREAFCSALWDRLSTKPHTLTGLSMGKLDLF